MAFSSASSNSPVPGAMSSFSTMGGLPAQSTPTHRESHHYAMSGPLKGTVPAAITPLTHGAARIDEVSIAQYVDFLFEHGASGVLAMGTAGEGILLDAGERRTVMERYVDAARG